MLCLLPGLEYILQRLTLIWATWVTGLCMSEAGLESEGLVFWDGLKGGSVFHRKCHQLVRRRAGVS